MKPLEAARIHNLFALGTNLYSGSAPEGEQGFASLARLGVKTIITVDGATPDVEAARRLGMRYVHLPHGYDGIRTNAAVRLVKASRELDGPIYVRCHHGRHRGPAATAVICMADLGWTPEQAEQVLVTGGTSTNYPGLFETIRTFEMPSASQLRALPEGFPETAKVSGLVEAMVEIDERWAHLQAVRDAGYRVPPDHRDLDPANEAVIPWEHYREAQRLPEVRHHDDDLRHRFSQAESEGREAQRLLELFSKEPGRGIETQLDRAFDAMSRSCVAYRQAYRNRSGVESNP